MCVIIVKNTKKQLKDNIIIASAKINPHGLGVLWLDTWKVEIYKSEDYTVLMTRRPFIAHFRFATVGRINAANCHPFDIDENTVLFQNGTLCNLGSDKKTDTQAMAEVLADIPPVRWREVLELTDCRFITADLKNKTFEIYNREMWVKRDGVLYSKSNVLDKHVIAVYGTLKRGEGNYYRYLSSADYLGGGHTSNRYPMIQRGGIPFVSPEAGAGHYIAVDLFLVSNKELERIDGLESHPEWYKRQLTKVDDEAGNELTAWLYFNDGADYSNEAEYIANFGRGEYADYLEELTRYDVRDYSVEVCPMCGGYDTQQDDSLSLHEYYCFDCDDYFLVTDHDDNDNETLTF